MTFKLPFFQNNGTKKQNKPLFQCISKDKGALQWRGTLPQTQLCTHFLYCLNLEKCSGGEILPPKFFKEATHEIRFGYRLDLATRPLSLLFVGQYDFTYKNTLTDWTAEIITIHIAHTLLDKKAYYPLLLRPDPTYWDLFIRTRFIELTTNYPSIG